MRRETDKHEKEPFHIFTDEEAGLLITGSLYADSEPEPLVKLLLIIHDRVQDARLKDAIYLLMKEAYKYSIVHSVNFQEYLDAIRRGQDPAADARTRGFGEYKSEA